MRRNLQLVFGALLVCFQATAVRGGVQTFSVDLFGDVAASGHKMSVQGTITLDPAMPAGSAITSSSLRFQFQNETPIALASRPNFFSNPQSNFEWSATGGKLYMNRISSNENFFGWEGFGTNTESFLFGTGRNDHRLSYSSEAVVLKPPSGPDGPTGFLVGTSLSEPIVPEPTSAMIWAGLAAAFSMRRRRRVHPT